jgi:hypothetical protein
MYYVPHFFADSVSDLYGQWSVTGERKSMRKEPVLICLNEERKNLSVQSKG